MTAREYLQDMAALPLRDKKRRLLEIRAGVETAFSERRRGFRSLTEVIDIGVAVSHEMQRRQCGEERQD